MSSTAPSLLQRRRFLCGGSASSVKEIRPPWALAETAFLEMCTRCDGCREACPQGIVVRGEGGYPVMDFTRGECTFCGACLERCAPRALLRASSITAPWQIKAHVDASCVAGRGVECRICGEMCNVRAIRFPPRLGAVALPQLDRDACSGCGACVASCPVGAIAVINPMEIDQ